MNQRNFFSLKLRSSYHAGQLTGLGIISRKQICQILYLLEPSALYGFWPTHFERQYAGTYFNP